MAAPSNPKDTAYEQEKARERLANALRGLAMQDVARGFENPTIGEKAHEPTPPEQPPSSGGKGLP